MKAPTSAGASAGSVADRPGGASARKTQRGQKCLWNEGGPPEGGPRVIGEARAYGVAAMASSTWIRPAPTASQGVPSQSVSQLIVAGAVLSQMFWLPIAGIASAVDLSV